jgi:hypothetical protein
MKENFEFEEKQIEKGFRMKKDLAETGDYNHLPMTYELDKKSAEETIRQLNILQTARYVLVDASFIA